MIYFLPLLNHQDMKMKNFKPYLLILTFIILAQINFAQKQIIINEISQGPHDDWEWIEYVVLEDGTDIRGVYLDDNDTLHGTLGSAKLVQLKTDLPAFENVSKGAIIVIYKSTDSTWFNGQDPKLYEAGAPDTDFSDSVIIIPHTDTTFLESGSWWPNFRSEGENLGIFDDSGVGIFGISYGDESPEGGFGNGWGMVNLVDVPYGGVGFYYGTLASTASDSTFWLLGTSTLGTPGTTNFGQGNIPVELVSFGAFIKNSEIVLNWLTATEVNNRGFEIERMADKIRWDKIGFVPGNGTTTETNQYEFIDSEIEMKSSYYYRLKQVDYNGTFTYSEIIEIKTDILNSFNLKQNYPNPFNPNTKIGFQIANSGFVSLKVYDIIGSKVATLVDENKPAGVYKIDFDAGDLPGGVYFYQLKAGDFIETKKMLLLK